jgi:DNA-binding transcriptional LysR family regulator
MSTVNYSLLKKLGVFVSVVRHASFTAAAEALGTPQPWVSVQVRQLERALGVQLLSREPRVTKLTPEGAALYPMAQKIMVDFEQLLGAARDLAAAGDVLRFETELSAVHDPLKNLLIARFVGRFQQRRLITSRARYDQIAERLITQDIDVAYSFFAGSNSRIETLPLAVHEIVLLTPVSSPLAAEKFISPEMLAGCQVLVGRREYSTDVNDRLRRLLDPYGVEWVVPPDPGHDCRVQMTQIMKLPSLWLDCLHEGSLPDDLVIRRFEGAPLTLEFALMRLAERRSKTIDLFWDLAKRMRETA